MTKTLTKQWREGTLERGFYYIRDRKKEIYESCLIDYKTEKHWVKEVLAPVPSYEEYNKLRKLPLKCFQLEETNSALMVINEDMCKEIERLQEQLNEANEVIKGYADCYKIYPDGTMFSFEVRKHPAHLYLEKWGVK